MTPCRKWLPLLLPLGAAALFLLLKLYLDQIAIFHIPCALWFLTGLYCPGCGGTRSIKAMLNGQLWLAVRYNPGVPLLALLGLLWYGEQLLAAFGIQKKNHSQKQAFLAAAPGNAHPVLFAAQWDQYASSTPVKLDFGAPEDVLLPPVLPRAD